jgi:hypothetical protein
VLAVIKHSRGLPVYHLHNGIEVHTDPFNVPAMLPTVIQNHKRNCETAHLVFGNTENYQFCTLSSSTT